MKRLVVCLLSLLSHPLFAQLNIIPAPAEIKMGKGQFAIDRTTAIILEGGNLQRSAKYLTNFFDKKYGFKIEIIADDSKRNRTQKEIVLNYERLDNELPGAYRLEVNDKQIYIAGDNEEGVFYGIQTLIQLIVGDKNVTDGQYHKLSVPQLSVTDAPRFEYRGAHLDVCRHFFSVEEVKQYIDYLATYKYNKFHWHLTDDQGWRIEIKKYPKLTSIGGYRNGTIIGRYPGKSNDSLHYGGFYTQDQIKEVVKYAADRYIEVIPEIEMPGHASAAIAAYPELSCFPEEDTKVAENWPWAGPRKGKQVQQTWGVFEDVFVPSENTFKFLQDVIDEIVPLFPSNYIHIGGDECPKDNWKRSAFCQQLIKENDLKDEHGLQSYFIRRMEKYINQKGKQIIGWDEILEGGLAPNATVMSWRGEDGGIAAAKENHDVIMTPQSYCYFDHSQSRSEDSVTIGNYLPLQKVYGYEPQPASLSADQQKHIKGAQFNLWTEYIGNMRKLEYMIFPRMIAFSEVLWSGKEQRNWKDFQKKLPAIFERLDVQRINHSSTYFDPKTRLINKDGKIYWELTSSYEDAAISYEKYVRGNPVTVTAPYIGPILIDKSSEFTVFAITKNFSEITKTKMLLNKFKQDFYINLASGKKISLHNEPSPKYAGDGAFTLVNGIQNTMGLVRPSEFLGFNGTDLEAIIDLGKTTFINEIALHVFEQTNSWIYRPQSVSFYSSSDSIHFKLLETTSTASGKINLLYSTKLTEPARFVKVVAKNAGKIPEGNPGAGLPAWLFADEIEVH